MDSIAQLPAYIEFFVPGKAAGAGSKTPRPTANGGMVLRPASKFTAPWMATVRAYAMEAMLKAGKDMIEDGPVLLWAEFRSARPTGHYGTGRNAGVLKDSAPHYWCCTGLDLTKRVRALEDAMTSIVWRNDRQVAAQNNTSIWCNSCPGVLVKVFRLEAR